MVGGVHGGVPHDGLNTFLLGEQGQLVAGDGVSETFSGCGEKEVVLKVLDGQGFDVDGIDGGGDGRLHPGDGVGGNGAVDEELSS